MQGCLAGHRELSKGQKGSTKCELNTHYGKSELVAHVCLYVFCAWVQVSPAPAVQARRLMKQWKLDNTYFVAKTLSERLVMSYHQKHFPVCIVRPSLVGCVAAAPFPGYIGNTSGFTAMVLGSLAGGHTPWA